MLSIPNTIFSCLLLFAYCLNSHALNSPEISQDSLRQLSTDNEWLALNHYIKQSDQHWESDISHNFFLSKRGSISPHNELTTFIERLTKNPQIIACKFPARTNFINRKLNFKIPVATCPEYDRWIKSHHTDSITLVYPSAYINNPSSTFGHTFLRFDTKGKSTPLSFTVDYTAHVPQQSGFISYIKNGLTGGFNGYFAFKPYYTKTWLYSDKENRKTWEYKLKFNRKEIHRLLRHLWELKEHSIKYYFVRKNCSFQILALLKAAKPELQFHDRFSQFTFPIDTIRLLEEKKLIQSVAYTPTLQEKIFKRYDQLKQKDKELVFDLLLASNQLQDFSTLNNFTIEDDSINALLFDLTSYQMRNSDRKKTTDQASIFLKNLPLTTASTATSLFNDDRIDSSHKTSRYSIGTVNDQLLLSYRHSYHSFSDPLNQFTRGTETEFMNIDIAYTDNKAELHNLTLLRMTSFQTSRLIFKPTSWQFDLSSSYINLQDNHIRNTSSHLAIGKSYSLGQASFYFLPLIGINHLSTDNEPYFLASAGALTGLLFQDKSTVLQFQSRYRQLYQSFYYLEHELSFTHQINKKISLNLQHQRTYTTQSVHDLSRLKLNYYF